MEGGRTKWDVERESVCLYAGRKRRREGEACGGQGRTRYPQEEEM